MTKLYDSQIAQILPDYLSTQPEVKSLSYAISKALRRLLDYASGISVFAMIDEAPDYVLDLLAVELDTQYYDADLPIENKRELIKGTFVWYMTAGTPSAVEELVKAAFGKGSVEEWFEYGGEPFFFKIKTSAKLTPDIAEFFAKMLRRVKNARSHIEQVLIERDVTVSARAAVGTYTFPNYVIAEAPKERERKCSISGTTGAGIVTYPGISISNSISD